MSLLFLRLPHLIVLGRLFTGLMSRFNWNSSEILWVCSSIPSTPSGYAIASSIECMCVQSHVVHGCPLEGNYGMTSIICTIQLKEMPVRVLFDNNSAWDTMIYFAWPYSAAIDEHFTRTHQLSLIHVKFVDPGLLFHWIFLTCETARLIHLWLVCNTFKAMVSLGFPDQRPDACELLLALKQVGIHTLFHICSDYQVSFHWYFKIPKTYFLHHYVKLENCENSIITIVQI